MASTRRTALLQWLLQLLSCYALVIIAVSIAIFYSGTIAGTVDAVVFFVTIASSVICVTTIIIMGRTSEDKGDHNDDHDNCDDDASHRHSNRGVTESSRTCRV